MRISNRDIAVCSWSLEPRNAADLIAKVRQLGLEHVQLALPPLLAMEDAPRTTEIDAIRAAGLKITATALMFPGEDYSTIATVRTSGGFTPDDQWPARKELAFRAGKLTASLGVKHLEMHVGFVPASSDSAYVTMVERVRQVAFELANDGIELLMETGQESASELLQFLNDLNCRNVGVNFDPANMILYGAGDPIEAIEILGRHIQHIHVKDAVSSSQPRVKWGSEVPFGSGEVGVEPFLDALDGIDYAGALAIEREAGRDRMYDIRTAIEVLTAADQRDQEE